MLDSKRIREDFPVLARQINGQSLVYLDSAATAQKPAAVLAVMDSFARERNGTVRRGMHALAEQATTEFEAARARVAEFVGAADPAEIVFTKNATEAINLVAYAWGRQHIGRGDAILLTDMEHHANLLPWYRLAEETGAELRFAGLTADGRLDRADFERKLSGAKLAAFTHVSNVLGTINPVAELTELAHQAGAKVLVDGTQAVPHLPVDVAALGPDWYVFTGHKCYGPTGVGVLRTVSAAYDEMEPFLTGGEMITSVGQGTVEYAEPPAKFEAGTPPVAEVLGLAAAFDYLSQLGMESVVAHDQQLVGAALSALSEVPGINVIGPADPTARIGLVAFTLDGAHPHDLATALDQDGIAIRSGRHCAQPLHDVLGIEASARASFGIYTTPADLNRLVAGVERATTVLA